MQNTITLEDLQKYLQQVQDAKQYVVDNHVKIVHLFNKEHPLGGVTVAYRPTLHDSTGYPKGDFAWIAFAYCKPTERYSRKVGEYNAVARLMGGIQQIKLPIYRHGHPVRFIRAMIELLDNPDI